MTTAATPAGAPSPARPPEHRAISGSLALLADFYAEHSDEIDRLAGEHRTIDFNGQRTEQPVTSMKVIDMFAFQAGFVGPRKALALQE